MEDIRISIRLSEEEHIALKIIAAKKRKTIQNILHDYIKEEIEKENKNEAN